MKVYITRLNKYKMLERLSSDIVAATNENEVACLRIYLDDWLELTNYDNRIEILRPDGEKYISKSLIIEQETIDGVDHYYIECPIVSCMCSLKGTYYVDLACTNGDYIFKSLNQIIYIVNESIMAIDEISDDRVQLLIEVLKDVYSADNDTITLTKQGEFKINDDWIENAINQPLSKKINEDSITLEELENGTYNLKIGGNE